VGRISGHRGRAGELTVRVFEDQAEPWTGLGRVWVAPPDQPERGVCYDVEADRAYRDRLVLKLAGVDDASSAAALRGKVVSVDPERLPPSGRGRLHAALLVDFEVVHEDGRAIGRVADVMRTGGPPLLVVEATGVGCAAGDAGEPILVPLAEEIVIAIDEERGVIRIRPPEGLLTLNREG
jgi:16S rRNA processing protein RimM